MSSLMRLRQGLGPQDLSEALAGKPLVADKVSPEVALGPLSESLAALSEDLRGSRLDQAMVEPVHRGLAGLTRSEAADMRTWHWVCAIAFPELVTRRWQMDATTASSPTTITDSVLSRFAGTASLVGVSRNTFARLWWTAEQLGGDYDLARLALSRQDMFQAIFERLFGLYEPAARGALSRFPTASEDAVRTAARWLNYVGATTVLEMLSEAEVALILDESLKPHPS